MLSDEITQIEHDSEKGEAKPLSRGSHQLLNLERRSSVIALTDVVKPGAFKWLAQGEFHP
jgi:hypothetical protein